MGKYNRHIQLGSGGLLIIAGLIGLWLAWSGWQISRTALQQADQSASAAVQLVQDSLATTQESLLLAQNSVADGATLLETVESSSANLSKTVRETQPFLSQTTDLVAGDLADSIETVQLTMPDLIQVAATMDDTLIALSKFKLDQNILGLPLQFDLGINYAPDKPFDETVAALGNSLEGVPPKMRAMSVYSAVTEENMSQISRDLQQLADDVGSMNENMSELPQILQGYQQLLTDVEDQLLQLRQHITTQLAAVQKWVGWLMLWFALLQIAPLYFGWRLIVVDGRLQTFRADELPLPDSAARESEG